MEYKVEINGIGLEANYSQKNIDEIFIPLLERLKDLQEDKGRRILAFLAAPPGAGKSTLLSFLKYLSESTMGLKPITIIGMDGFHHYQDYLLNHTIMRDGKEYAMVQIKGAPETFDLDLLLKRVKRVASGEACGWPDYNRMTHNPREDAVIVTGDIVMLEGNYLLLNRLGWSELKKYADITISVSADSDMLRKRLIDRKIKSGGTLEQATKFVDFSDMANVHLCMKESSNADICLDLCADGSYKLHKS